MSALAGDFAWIQALGWSLLHFVWQGLVVGALFGVASSVVPREHSSIRYAIGLVALAALALCPFVTLWMLWPQAELLTTTIGSMVVANGVVTEADLTVESAATLTNFLPWLVLAWFVGVAFMTWRAANQWRALDRIATSLAYRQADLEELLFRVAQRFGGIPGARVLVSNFIDTPTLIGWFKPVILLPAAVVLGFPRQQLELILAHELGHLRRYDHLVNLGQAIIETLLFYHPVVHWVSREVRHEREVCCDNLVLKLTDSEPREYARTLAALENVRQLTPQLAVAASGGMLLDRVRRIVGSNAPDQSAKHPALRAWLVAGTGVLVAVVAALASKPAVNDSLASFDQPTMATAVHQHGPMILSADLDAGLQVNFAVVPLPPSTAMVYDVSAAARSAAQKMQSVAATSESFAMPVATPKLERATVLPIAIANMDFPNERSGLSLGKSTQESQSRPAVVHKVSPDYPDNSRGARQAKIGFEFAIDSTGGVTDIEVISGDGQSAFAMAARRALRQWRFDPSSLQAREGEKFRQDFEFVGGAKSLVDTEGRVCTPPTGSHVCRSDHQDELDHSTIPQKIILAGGGISN